MVDVRAPRRDGLHRRHELRVVAIRDQAVREIVDAYLIVGRATTYQRAVDRYLAKFVDENRQPARLAALNQATQQSGFSRTEKAGDDSDGNRRRHTISSARNWASTSSVAPAT